MVFQTYHSLMQLKRFVECSNGSILRCFRLALSLSYNLSLRALFCLFLSGRLRHVLLYTDDQHFLCDWVVYFRGTTFTCTLNITDTVVSPFEN